MQLEDVTIYLQGMFGVQRIDCRQVAITPNVKYAQYTSATRIVYREKGKRKDTGFVLTNSTDKCLIVPTKEAVATRDPLGPVENGSRQSRYLSFAKEYWDELIEDISNAGATILFDYTEKVGA